MVTKKNLVFHDPELQAMGGMPIWHHHHSWKIRVAKAKSPGLLLMKGSAAEISISPKLGEQKGLWILGWSVTQSLSEKAGGTIVLDTKHLKIAFGLEEDTPEQVEKSGSAWLINRYGGTTARQGFYIRWEDYLNVPCPGTGHDGDPNISVKIDPEIQEAVRALIGE